MIYRVILCVLGVLLAYNCFAQKNKNPDAMVFESFDMKALERKLKESDKSYLSFLKKESLSSGMYHLAAGETDHQKPLDRDEVYYVLEGKSKFTVADKTIDIKKGSVLFVVANTVHKFHHIEENLKILVFFAAKDK